MVDRLAAGDRWDLVFNIAEGLHGIAREAQVPAILDLYQIPYTFSDPLVLALTLHKGLTKVVVRDAGLPTPDFALVERLEDVDRVDLPLAAVRQAGGRRDRQGDHGGLEDRATGPSLRPICAELLARYRQPVLVETFLPGREFTVGMLGPAPEAGVLGSMEVAPPARGRGRRLLLREQGAVRGTVPSTGRAGRTRTRKSARPRQLALAAYRALGCRDAGRVDLRSDAQGRPHFIEVNPAGRPPSAAFRPAHHLPAWWASRTGS